MRYTYKEFQDRLENHGLVVLLLGFSGVGKSMLAQSLSDSNFAFQLISIDENIGVSEQFQDLIIDSPGKSKVEKLGNYFGNIWSDPHRYAKQEQLYLSVERNEMQKVVKIVENKNHGNLIVDLTGSAIYLATELEQLKQYGIIIYLETEEDQFSIMLQTYFDYPKPVCWGPLLQQWNQGMNQNDFQKLYLQLLKGRHKEYRRFADVILSWTEHRRNINGNSEHFLRCIQEKLASY